MRNWVKTRVRTNRPIDPELFTRDVAIAESIRMVNQSEEVTTEMEVKMPEKFKLSTKWIVFSESVDTYLNRLKGQGRIPLNYIIRTVETPEEDEIFTTEQELMVATAPLEGDQFDVDNERVYGVIKQLILEGPAWSYITDNINRTKDGRAAWLALRSHYEGESFLNKQKEEAYKILKNLHYKGERATFTFEHFSGLLTKAYNDLQRYGEPIIESKKVRDLLNKITDPKLESAKQAVKINSNYKNNFTMAINFIAESVDTLDQAKTRGISEMTRGNTFSRGRGNNGNNGRSQRHNRTSGRGHQNNSRLHGGLGRGGTRRGRGRGRGRYNQDNYDRSANSGYIPPAEWHAMTHEQRQAFMQAQTASRIQAITTALADDMSTITGITQQQITPQQASQTSSVPFASIAAVSTGGGSNTYTPNATPFGGRAAHGGRTG
jgi:hypothetical protein